MYSRLHTGHTDHKSYLNKLLTNKIGLIDYELIRSDDGKSIVGSSELAGFVGLFNTFRVLGEHLLLKKGINNPFLHLGGSAYMHRDKQHCIESLK